ncbi:hypothetical protein OUZ56_011831 [Daphnia magna]|uniref:Uncharacterized protein n=1 Tax=Daphnia magna TaxID=35525 RepID=A0ABQ9Z1A8_9CRUS|nr:hypothetical protein OUZ56_011831 [Daphnia magna]
MSQGDVGAISLTGSDTQPKQTCGYCCKKYKGKKDSRFCCKLYFYGHQKMASNKTAQIINSLSQGAIAGGGDPRKFCHVNRKKQCQTLEEDQIEKKKIRYEDLSSIMEDKDLTLLDSLNKEEIVVKLLTVIEYIKLQQERVMQLEANLVDLKLVFADAMTDQFVHQRSSPPVFTLKEDLHHAGKPSYTEATKVQQAPVLVASIAAGAAPADRISLAEMENCWNPVWGVLFHHRSDKRATIFMSGSTTRWTWNARNPSWNPKRNQTIGVSLILFLVLPNCTLR